MKLTTSSLRAPFMALAALLFAGLPALQASDRVTPDWLSSRYWKRASPAEVTVTGARQGDDHVLTLAYVFEANGGRYAGAYLYKGVETPFYELRLKARSATTGRLLVRFFEKGGEVLQYTVPLEASGEWSDIRINLDRPSHSFPVGKDALLNKKPDFPFTGILFGLEVGTGVVAEGELQLAGLELLR